MKMNKDQFFSALAAGKVKNFTYKGVKYFAESVTNTDEFTGRYIRWFYDIIKLKPSEVDIRDLEIGSGFVIKVKKNSPQEKFLKSNPKILQSTKEEFSKTDFAAYVKLDDNATYFGLEKEDFKDLKKAIELIKKLPDDSVDLYVDIPVNKKGWRKL